MLLPVLLGVAIIACLSGCASQRTPVESVNEAGFVAATRSGPYLLRIGDEACERVANFIGGER